MQHKPRLRAGRDTRRRAFRPTRPSRHPHLGRQRGQQ